MTVAGGCCGIQSQDPRESLTAFWARIDAFRKEEIAAELRPGGGLVRTWAIRSTMHTIPSQDYYTYIYGGASERMLNWINTIARKARYLEREDRQRLLYEPILDAIKGRAVTDEEIRSLVDERAPRLGMKRGAWSGIGEMAFGGRIVHAGKRGSRNLWMRSDEWVPRPRTPPDRESCRAELVRHYLVRHGPVARDDILSWAYLSKGQLDQALDRIRGDLVEVKLRRSGEPLLALASAEAGEAPPAPKAIVLPKYDSLLLALKDKSRFMDMAQYKQIFPRLPVGMVRATVLVDGFLAASWDRATAKGKTAITVRALRHLASRDRKAVERRFDAYAEFAGLDATVRWAGVR